MPSVSRIPGPQTADRDMISDANASHCPLVTRGLRGAHPCISVVLALAPCDKLDKSRGPAFNEAGSAEPGKCDG